MQIVCKGLYKNLSSDRGDEGEAFIETNGAFTAEALLSFQSAHVIVCFRTGAKRPVRQSASVRVCVPVGPSGYDRGGDGQSAFVGLINTSKLPPVWF